MEVLTKAGILVAIIAIGYGIKRLGWLKESDFGTLSIIALRLTLPCALIVSFDRFTIRLDMLFLALFGFGVVSLGQAYIWLTERRRGPKAQGFGMLNNTYNIGLFTIPYVGAFLGPEAIIAAAMFDVGNALAGAGTGYAGGMALARGVRPSPLGFLKTLASSAVFMTYLIVAAIGIIGWKLPAPVIGFAEVVGGANTFVAMLMIGVGLQLVLDKTAYKEALRHLLGRWLISGIGIAVLWLAMPFSHTEKAVVTAILMAPMAAMSSGFTAEAGLSVRVSVFMTTVTVLLAIVAMPVTLALLS